MRRLPSSKRGYYLIRIGIFLLIVVLIAGTSGCTNDNYTLPSKDLEIRTWYDLDAVRDNLAGHHVLMNDLDSTTPGYDELAGPTANGGQGWDPIGRGAWTTGPSLFGEFFKGSFDGQGHEIHDLCINSRYRFAEAGLFGCIGKGAVITDLGVVNATVMVSENAEALVTLSRNTVDILDVAPISAVGIVAGFSMGSVSNSYASGTINWSYYNIGGFVGQNTGTVDSCYSTANVTGLTNVGGLIGCNGDLIIDGTVTNSYSTGNVTGGGSAGGLVGENQAIGAGVDFQGVVSNSFWDIETSGQATSDGGTGKTTAEMKDKATFSGAGWSIIAVALNETNLSCIWNIVNNVTYPFLSWQAIQK
jgi:The GLUG motif